MEKEFIFLSFLGLEYGIIGNDKFFVVNIIIVLNSGKKIYCVGVFFLDMLVFFEWLE